MKGETGVAVAPDNADWLPEAALGPPWKTMGEAMLARLLERVACCCAGSAPKTEK